MKSFSYNAYDSQGVKTSGVLEAASHAEAKILLTEKRLFIVDLRETRSSEFNSGLHVRKKVTAKELEFLTSELAILLNSGVTISRALSVMKRSSSSVPQNKLLSDLTDGLRRGETLSQSMLAHGNIFSPLYVNLVKLGESSGTLPRVFSRLSQDLKFQSELRSKIIQALMYPMVITFVCLLCIVFTLNYIVPQMSTLFEGLPEMPIYTSILIGMSEWMVKYQFFLLLFFIASIVLIIGLSKTDAGRQWLDGVIFRLPFLSQASIQVESIRFNTAIAMMLESGILIDKCLEMALGSLKSVTLRQELEKAKNRVKKGEPLSDCLGTSPLFSDFSLSLVEAGEESGQLGIVFNELSNRARAEFESWVGRFTSLLEPILILIMGFIVGGIVVVMLLSVLSVNEISL